MTSPEDECTIENFDEEYCRSFLNGKGCKQMATCKVFQSLKKGD